MKGRGKNLAHRARKQGGHLTEFKCERKGSFPTDEVLGISVNAKYNY
jgi:hypothetical protein